MAEFPLFLWTNYIGKVNTLFLAFLSQFLKFKLCDLDVDPDRDLDES